MHPSILAAHATIAECSARRSFARDASAGTPSGSLPRCCQRARALPEGLSRPDPGVCSLFPQLFPRPPLGCPLQGKRGAVRQRRRRAPASPAAPVPGPRRVQSIGDTITVSPNCFFMAAAPGSKRLTIKIICRRAVDKTLLIASCKFGADTSTFISHPGNNIPSHQTGRRGQDRLQSFRSTRLTKDLVKIKEWFLVSEIRALWLPKRKHKIAPA